MKALLTLTLICSFGISAPATVWKNGGESKSIETVIFGTHDWIVWKAYLMASNDGDFNWLKINQNYMFFGTEAPDVGLSKLPTDFRTRVIGDSGGKKYKDTGRCHCVLYGTNGQPFKSVAAERIVEEFNKAKKAIKQKRWKYAAFYVGAMAHYAGDLSQFMHLMGKDSQWNNGKGENQKVHGYYEKAFDDRVDFDDKTLDVLEPFIKSASISGGTAEEIAFEIAKYTDRSTGGQQDIDWLYSEGVKYYTKKIKQPEDWDPKVLDQTGRNINKAVNGIARLIVLLGTEA